jgi:hypothetical protein
MATATLSPLPPDPGPPPFQSRLEQALGHPLAYLLTAAILVALFGWTFFTDSQRTAPTKDPAYYTWRTEMLMSEKPETLLSVTGPFDVFAGGYRVASPVLGAFLRRIAGISPLRQTIFLVVLLPVGIALLLAGFALRQRGDPLIFHAVALTSGSLLLTPPFVGYLDNMLCLFFLSAAVWFITPARTSWHARAGLAIFLVLCGFTHPTTLAIFCFVLVGMAFLRLILSRFDLAGTLRSDGPVLAIALASAVVTYAAWKFGIWGPSAPLSEAALAPPYGSGFFLERLKTWIGTMHPLLNGPLFVVGVLGLVTAGRRAADDDLTRVALVWLAPLLGLFGFVAGFTYPYYRFFNTTVAWVLLVGLGAYFAIGFFLEVASGGGLSRLALVGVAAVVVIIGVNFADGLGASGWNNPAAAWLSSGEKRDLDAVRAYLAQLSQPERPVVFVVDNKPPAPFQIYGFTKLAGNTSRYGLPAGQIDRGYLYLGSLDNFVRSKPTLTGDATYDRLSKGFLGDVQRGVAASGKDPIVVLDAAFNTSGANAGMADNSREGDTTEIVKVEDGRVTSAGLGKPSGRGVSELGSGASIWHVPRVLLGLFALLLPGLLALDWFFPRASFGEMLGLVPALSLALLSLIGIPVLGITRSPFSGVIAWLCLALAVLLGASLRMRARNSRQGAA